MQFQAAHHRSLRTAAAVAALLAAQGSASVPASAARTVVSARAAAPPVGDMSHGEPRVAYIAEFFGNRVALVGRDAPHRQIGTIQDSVLRPTAVAIDEKGNLFVANFAHGYDSYVAEYAPGSNVQKVIYKQGITYLDTVTVVGDRIFANSGTGDSIVVFREGNTTPIETIRLPYVEVGAAMVVDRHGNIFFTIPENFPRANSVYERIAATKQVVDLSYESFLKRPVALAFDNKGNLVILDSPGKKKSPPAKIYVVSPQSSLLLARIQLNAAAGGLALDADGNHLWIDEGTQVSEYTYPQGTLLSTFGGSSYCTVYTQCVGAPAFSPASN